MHVALMQPEVVTPVIISVSIFAAFNEDASEVPKKHLDTA